MKEKKHFLVSVSQAFTYTHVFHKIELPHAARVLKVEILMELHDRIFVRRTSARQQWHRRQSGVLVP